jgi:hypothetical protein
MRMTHNNKKSLIQLLEVEGSEFTKHHKDMALRIWLALLLSLAVEIHGLTRMLQTRNTIINGL